MDSATYTSRIVVCLSCSRMAMISDPTPVKTTSGFWDRNTFHVIVCSMCESSGVTQVSTTTRIYTSTKTTSASYVSSAIIKASIPYSRACEMTSSTPDMGEIDGRVPIVNRTKLITSFPDRTQINYISVSEKKSMVMGMRPYMVANFF